MMRKAESARRLIVLANFLEKLPKEKFDYSSWAGLDWNSETGLSCGTTACALGWATTIPEFAKLGLHIEKSDSGVLSVLMEKPARRKRIQGRERISVWDSGAYSLASGATIFGLTMEEAEFLFIPETTFGWSDETEGSSPTETATPKHVAAHIRCFVAAYRS